MMSGRKGIDERLHPFQVVPAFAVATLLVGMGTASARISPDGTQLQAIEPASMPAAPAQAMPQELLLQEGTLVRMELIDLLSTKSSKQGDIFRLRLLDDLLVNGQIVAPKGSLASGTVTYAEKARFLGEGGELYYRIDYLKAGEHQIHLRASRHSEGKDSTGAAVALIVLFGVFGMLKKGKDLALPGGSVMEAYVAQDTRLPVYVP